VYIPVSLCETSIFYGMILSTLSMWCFAEDADIHSHKFYYFPLIKEESVFGQFQWSAQVTQATEEQRFSEPKSHTIIFSPQVWVGAMVGITSGSRGG
jgi:hypothetical protein